MKYEIVAQNEAHVTGVLSGWDRLVFRGCLTSLAYLEAMCMFLGRTGVLLKNFADWSLKMSEAMKQACLAEAERQGRPVVYLRSSQIRKDELAREILRSQPVAEGLICLFTCLEPCMTYRVRGNREAQRLELRREQGKCLHVYKYWIDSQFGFTGARLQTWLPCNLQVYVNGREWLARRMDRRGLGYQREGNCFPQIDEFAAAQKMMNQMQRTDWIRRWTACGNDFVRATRSVWKAIATGPPFKPNGPPTSASIPPPACKPSTIRWCAGQSPRSVARTSCAS